MDVFEIRKLTDNELREIYIKNMSKLYNTEEKKTTEEFNQLRDLVGNLYSEFVRRLIPAPSFGSIKQKPSTTVLTPETETKPAANIIVDEGIGGLPNFDALRLNYLARRDLIMKERDQQGQSSGGANYVNVLYDKKENSMIYNPNPCGGYRNYFHAYGDQQKTYCVKNLDEY